ncbi:MAG: ATP-binding protein [Oligoflexales bacterium]|nr:ATP-binding protein [Oligoflexales bacterium]
MYKRILQLNEITRKSIFLLGPRQVGKSTLIRQQLDDYISFNLLDTGVYRQLSADPGHMKREIIAQAEKKLVVIDEIQLLPELLNEVHLLIEEHKKKFILTGSSARALKRKGVNLLGGRANMYHLHPFVSCELGEDFDLDRAINNGLLPPFYLSENANKDLGDYIGLYLKEEIAAEGLTRNIPSFSRFLEVAALSNGTIININNIASDAEVKRTTVADWLQVLKDTLIAYELPAWTKTKNRKAIARSKFYFFDVGVVRFLTGQREIERQNPWYGIALETFIFHELKAYVDYGRGQSLQYWRSTSGFEVDFLLDEKFAIEIKAATNVNKNDFKGLNALQEESKPWKRILVYLGASRQDWDGIKVYPLKKFLELLWNEEL